MRVKAAASYHLGTFLFDFTILFCTQDIAHMHVQNCLYLDNSEPVFYPDLVLVQELRQLNA